MRIEQILGTAVLLAVATAGCGQSASEPPPVDSSQGTHEFAEGVPMNLHVRSDAFQQGQPIPVKYTGDGDDVSPPLAWDKPPEGAQEFALICDDPDAPSAEPWVHWVIYGIPGDVTSLPAGIPPKTRVESPVSALQGKNSWSGGRTVGYRGPAPPKGHGVHHYHFKLYALDAKLNLEPGLTKRQLLDAIESHVIATGELVGTYSR